MAEKIAKYPSLERIKTLSVIRIKRLIWKLQELDEWGRDADNLHAALNWELELRGLPPQTRRGT